MLAALALAAAFVAPSYVGSFACSAAGQRPMRIVASDSAPEITRTIIQARKDDPQSGGNLAVYVNLRPKMEALFVSVAGDTSSTIAAPQLSELMTAVGEDLTEEEVDQIMRETGANGYMNFAKWAKYMMDGVPSAEPPKKGFFGLF